MPARMEVTMDKCMSGKKVLGVPGGFEIVASAVLDAGLADVNSRHDC